MASSQPYVLVVEDQPEDVRLLQRAFFKAGVPVPMIVMHDGEEAIHYLEACVARTPARTSPIPDVLLLDVKMPRVNGFEVLTWIRSQSELAHLPVVMFSSSDLPADLEASQKLGATDYWLKTADSQKLIGLVRELRDRWLPAAA